MLKMWHYWKSAQFWLIKNGSAGTQNVQIPCLSLLCGFFIFGTFWPCIFNQQYFRMKSRNLEFWYQAGICEMWMWAIQLVVWTKESDKMQSLDLWRLEKCDTSKAGKSFLSETSWIQPNINFQNENESDLKQPFLHLHQKDRSVFKGGRYQRFSKLLVQQWSRTKNMRVYTFTFSLRKSQKAGTRASVWKSK